MTFWGKAISFFPLLHILIIVSMTLHMLLLPTVGSLLLLGVAIYVVPLILFRLHNCFFTILEGLSRFDLPKYSPWWTTHQLQAVFNAFPFLETVLRLIPGAFSSWLRLWGGQVGRKVYWTSRVEIIDRNLVAIGDHVIFGHKAILCSHAVVRKPNGSTILYVKRICIGAEAFIGAGSQLGPGTAIAAKQIIPFGTVLTINKTIAC